MHEVEGHTLPGRMRLRSPFVGEAVIGSLIIAAFGFMLYHTYEWKEEAALFPRLISIVGISSTIAYLVQQGLIRKRGEPAKGGRILDIAWTRVESAPEYVKRAAWGSIASAVAFWLGVVLVGFHVAAPIYLYSQLVIFGKVKRWVAASGGAAIFAMIILVYDQLAGTTWNDPLLWRFVKWINPT